MSIEYMRRRYESTYLLKLHQIGGIRLSKGWLVLNKQIHALSGCTQGRRDGQSGSQCTIKKVHVLAGNTQVRWNYQSSKQ